MQNKQIKSYNLPNDLKFLICCCQSEQSDEDIEFITQHISGKNSQQLKKLISFSYAHGILPLVYKSIEKLSLHDKSIIPAEFLSTLKLHYKKISLLNLLMLEELIRIFKLFEKNNIQSLAFKGPSLSQMAYGDVTLRQFVDLDVLIKKDDIHKIDRLLQKNGYERFLILTQAQETIWIKYAHDLGLLHSNSGIHLEMHWSFLDEDYPMKVNLQNYWEETQQVKLNGHSISTFTNENLIIYLAIHGSKHLWERIEWVKDIDQLIRENDINWEKLIEKTNGTGFEKMVYLGLSLNATLFDTPLPECIQKKLAHYPKINHLFDFIFESWTTPKNSFQKLSAMLKLFPGLKEKLIYLHKVILKPSLSEYWYVTLPKGFQWGYYLVRPYLLLKKYFTRKA